MSDALPPINTNDLRDYAERIENPYSQFVLDAASELDATRTERNLLRQSLATAEARVKRLEEALGEMLKCAAFVKGAVDLDDYEIRAQQLVRLVENRAARELKGPGQ